MIDFSSSAHSVTKNSNQPHHPTRVRPERVARRLPSVHFSCSIQTGVCSILPGGDFHPHDSKGTEIAQLTFFKRAAATVLAAAALTGVAVGPAQAADLFDHAYYGGERYNAFQSYFVGGMNDRTSSIRTGNGTTVYEDSAFRGRAVRLYGSIDHLGHLTNNLAWFENWNDRISSYR